MMTTELAFSRQFPGDGKAFPHAPLTTFAPPGREPAEANDSKKEAEKPSPLTLSSFIGADALVGIDAMKLKGTSEDVKHLLAGFSLTSTLEPQSGTVQTDAPSSKPGDPSLTKPPTAPQPIEPSRFVAVGKEVLARLDPDRKGLSKQQLVAALEDPSFKGEEAQVLASMYDSFDQLSHIQEEKPKKDRTLREIVESKSLDRPERPLTAADLDAYEKMRPEQDKVLADAHAMTSWAQANIDRYGHNKALSSQDITVALDNKDTPEPDKKILKLIQDHFSEIASGKSAVKLGDFDAHEDFLAGKNSDSGMVWRMETICRRTAKEAQTPGKSHELFATANALDSINPDAVRQGATGDCYFDSALAAVAKAHPELIRDAIKQNADGTYTVTFPGAASSPVTVKAPTEAELGLYNGASSGDGIWPGVMEKAFGELRREHPEMDFYRHKGAYKPQAVAPGTPEDGAGGGGAAAPCIKLLTGHDTDTVDAKTTSNAEMDKKLREAFSTERPRAVAAEIKADIGSLFGGNPDTADGFIKQHAYTIVDYATDEKGGPYVVVRNPWAGKPGTTYGTIKIPLDEFMKNFDIVAIENS